MVDPFMMQFVGWGGDCVCVRREGGGVYAGSLTDCVPLIDCMSLQMQAEAVLKNPTLNVSVKNTLSFCCL